MLDIVNAICVLCAPIMVTLGAVAFGYDYYFLERLVCGETKRLENELK